MFVQLVQPLATSLGEQQVTARIFTKDASGQIGSGALRSFSRDKHGQGNAGHHGLTGTAQQSHVGHIQPSAHTGDAAMTEASELPPIPSQWLMGESEQNMQQWTDNTSYHPGPPLTTVGGARQGVNDIQTYPTGSQVLRDARNAGLGIMSTETSLPSTLQMRTPDHYYGAADVQASSETNLRTRLQEALSVPQSIAPSITSRSSSSAYRRPVSTASQVSMANRQPTWGAPVLGQALITTTRNDAPLPQASADDGIPSATDIMTPTPGATPDLRKFDGFGKALKEVKTLTDDIGAEIRKAQGENMIITHTKSPLAICAPSEAGEAHPVTTREQNASVAGSHRSTSDKAPQLLTSLSGLLPHLSNLTTHLSTFPTLVNDIRIHSDRLEQLENASFSGITTDHLEQRVDMLEDWRVQADVNMEDLDKRVAAITDDNGSSLSFRHKTSRHSRYRSGVADSFNSITSGQSTTSSALIAAAMDRHETEARMQTLEARLMELEATAPPSAQRPWEIEVVFIPWGRSLRGLWYSADSYPSSSVHTQLEWNESSARKSQSAPVSQKGQGWDGEAIERWASSQGTEDWMVPRAPGPNNTTYERLKSRGFVQNIPVKAGGANDLQAAIAVAFQLVHQVKSFKQESLSRPSPTQQKRDTFHGLCAPFIPLRKVHKESRLHFLKPEEMLTSALWTCDFIANNVAMRHSGGLKRLFVTSRDAYMQPDIEEKDDWTWQKLRELPRIDSQKGDKDYVPEGDAKEACWEYDPRFDTLLSIHSSLASSFLSGQQPSAQLQTYAPPTMKDGAAVEIEDAIRRPASPSPPRNPISPISEFPPSSRTQQQQQRITSVTTAPAHLALVQEQVQHSRRRIASQEAAKPAVVSHKRRRTSRASSADKSAIWNPTPRRSNSPFQFFQDQEMELVNQGVVTRMKGEGSRIVSSESKLSSGRERGTTPFAYATPHSGTAYVDRDEINNDVEMSDDDSEAEDDDDDEDSEEGEEEEEGWEGVADEAQVPTASRPSSQNQQPSHHSSNHTSNQISQISQEPVSYGHKVLIKQEQQDDHMSVSDSEEDSDDELDELDELDDAAFYNTYGWRA
jgi:hypothetical protein